RTRRVLPAPSSPWSATMSPGASARPSASPSAKVASSAWVVRWSSMWVIRSGSPVVPAELADVDDRPVAPDEHARVVGVAHHADARQHRAGGAADARACAAEGAGGDGDAELV